MISVIVPVYNVDSYLHKCVNSILHQSYNDIEIILVDDGSTDSSGKICDEYAKNYSHIVVIHKGNGGLSSARNAGLSIAKGEYLSFVDSDDWIELDYLEILMSRISDDVDISSCGLFLDYPDRVVDKHSPRDCIISAHDIIGDGIINLDWFGNYFCNKLFKRNLLDGLQFPVGVAYEDVALLYKVILNANKISIVSRSLYHYFQGNTNAITKSRLMKARFDMLIAQENRFRDLSNRNLGLDLSYLAETAFSSVILLCTSTDMKCNWMYDNAILFAKELSPYKTRLRLSRKLMLFMCLHCPMFFNRIVKITRKLLHR